MQSYKNNTFKNDFHINLKKYGMKILFYCLTFLALFACASKTVPPKKEKMESHNFSPNTCAENGNCTMEIFKKSELLIRKDDAGQLYVEIIPGAKNVIKYSYIKKSLEDIADSGYQEIILFEFLNGEINLHLQNKNLQEANLIFGRLCYCKGESGYFRVTKGDLKITADNKELKVDLKFQAEVPQIIYELKETIKPD